MRGAPYGLEDNSNALLDRSDIVGALAETM